MGDGSIIYNHYLNHISHLLQLNLVTLHQKNQKKEKEKEKVMINQRKVIKVNVGHLKKKLLDLLVYVFKLVKLFQLKFTVVFQVCMLNKLILEKKNQELLLVN